MTTKEAMDEADEFINSGRLRQLLERAGLSTEAIDYIIYRD